MDIEKLRQSRNKGVVVYTKFCLYKDFYADHLFCFFEGEDNKYYGPRIESYTQIHFDQIVSFNCGGRDAVLKARELITKEPRYHQVPKAFFIDHDYIPCVIDNFTDVYQTPCYSIENFYSSKTSFAKILAREFLMNTTDSDHCNCMGLYSAAQTTFHSKTLYFNAWLKCQRLEEEKYRERRIILSDFKISSLFNLICIDRVDCDEIDEKLIIALFQNSYKITQASVEEICAEFVRNDVQQCSRGKFELEFLLHIIDDLKKKNKDGGFFKEKHSCVKIDARANPLSSLSLYADTPLCLIKFLQNYVGVLN